MSHSARAASRHRAGVPLRGYDDIDGDRHDPYHARAKPAEPAWCPVCGAVFEQGRWHWKERLSSNASQLLCAACQRTHDDMPAGIVQIEGDYAKAHRDELLAMLRHRAEHARSEHPLQRIMAIRESTDGLQVRTTDLHLAHQLAQALQQTHHGELQLHYSDAQVRLRARWKR